MIVAGYVIRSRANPNAVFKGFVGSGIGMHACWGTLDDPGILVYPTTLAAQADIDRADPPWRELVEIREL